MSTSLFHRTDLGNYNLPINISVNYYMYLSLNLQQRNFEVFFNNYFENNFSSSLIHIYLTISFFFSLICSVARMITRKRIKFVSLLPPFHSLCVLSAPKRCETKMVAHPSSRPCCSQILHPQNFKLFLFRNSHRNLTSDYRAPSVGQKMLLTNF